jgi:menaquinone-dependent protoporphyrinogen oxidase
MTVLVTCASKHGATTEIAEALGRELCARGIDADVIRAEEVDGVGSYDAVVLGSAIYMGHWLPAARAVADVYADDLAEKPTWLFSSGPIGDPPRPAEEPNLGDLLERIRPRGHRIFAGKLEKENLSLTERGIARLVKQQYGDFRDWEDVAGLADEIARGLRG